MEVVEVIIIMEMMVQMEMVVQMEVVMDLVILVVLEWIISVEEIQRITIQEKLKKNLKTHQEEGEIIKMNLLNQKELLSPNKLKR